ncbi:hypothetical protein, variant [Batrachochytrium dendrobatidis JEL423]|uniref:peptidylprolyl isomerase n=2 Tax=Batrachochytrium dendrobatidis TaxID=109871 RepID=A0A177WEK9_BATDL|nr:hypothetical protein, variant [Batrachochytrium dendrobatidis JEL423]
MQTGLTTHNEFVSLDDSNHVCKKLLSEGSGDLIDRPGTTMRVHYTGSLYPSGEVFDSSLDRDEPIQIRLGQGMVIKGWDVGLATMRVGEKASLLIYPEYGYGPQGSPPKIPGNSTLLFDVELVSADLSTADKTTDEKIAAATLHKDEGNNYFKHSEFALAKECYLSALKLFKNTRDTISAEHDTIKQLQITLNCNLAAVYLKLKDFSAAVDCCQKVKSMDMTNAKATYRLSQAYTGQGQFDDAVNMLQSHRDVSGL